MLHEYGHLAGYRDPLNPSDPTHSHDPDDIMWPFEHYDHRCDDYGSALLGVPRPPEAPAPGAGGRARQECAGQGVHPGAAPSQGGKDPPPGAARAAPCGNARPRPATHGPQGASARVRAAARTAQPSCRGRERSAPSALAT